MFLVSFIKQGLTGKEVDRVLGEANITVNMNAVPNDPQSPFVTSGIRIGTPAVTTRGFSESDCETLAGWICDICDDLGNESIALEVKKKAKDLCAKYPVYK
jgi:glycine hydroxymethyltransferase